MKYIKPTFEQIKNLRHSKGLTQLECSVMLHCSLRHYKNWESGSYGMPVGYWELMNLKMRKRRMK